MIKNKWFKRANGDSMWVMTIKNVNNKGMDNDCTALASLVMIKSGLFLQGVTWLMGSLFETILLFERLRMMTVFSFVRLKWNNLDVSYAMLCHCNMCEIVSFFIKMLATKPISFHLKISTVHRYYYCLSEVHPINCYRHFFSLDFVTQCLAAWHDYWGWFLHQIDSWVKVLILQRTL